MALRMKPTICLPSLLANDFISRRRSFGTQLSFPLGFFDFESSAMALLSGFA
jgi:hypothetical protein